MGELQDVIDRSLSNATAFTASLFEAEAWDAARVIGFINATRSVTIATASDRGVPHAAIVLAACVGEAVYFTVWPGSVLARNLGASPRVAFSACDRSHGIMAQGRAERVGGALELPDLMAALATAAGGTGFTPKGWTGDIYRLRPARIFAS